jgi:regulatory protein YycI of two-component signal transduction system YycFG
MSATITVEQRLLDKIRKLTAEKLIEVEDFIDFLYQRQTVSDYNLVMAATKISEASFSKVWDNPEDAEYDNL